MSPTHIARYEVIERIGQGGMGAVYLARDPAIGRRLAIKLLKEEFDEDLRLRFEREARSVGQIEHGNIVTIYDIGVHEGRPYIAMSYIAGETLAQLIRRKEPIPPIRKLAIVEEICAGLHAAHKVGIVHRDMKPANVMVDPHGVVKILDFGIARLASEATQKTQDGTIMGTYNYMSPEQIAGKPLDHRSDIFAVGAIFYEVLSSTRAFSGSLGDGLWYRLVHEPPRPLGELCQDLDPDVERIVMRALEKDASNRYQDLETMRRDLSRVRRRMTAAEVGILVADAERALSAKDLEKAFASAQAATALDPDHTQAIAITERTKAAMNERLNQKQQDAQLQADHERRAREAVDAANRRVALGDHRGAMAILISFSPAHPLVARLMDELLQEARTRLANATALFESGNYRDALKVGDLLIAQIPERSHDLRSEVETLLDRVEDAFAARVVELETQRSAATELAEDRADTDRITGDSGPRRHSATATPLPNPATSNVDTDVDDDDDAPTQVIERPGYSSPADTRRLRIIVVVVVVVVAIVTVLLVLSAL